MKKNITSIGARENEFLLQLAGSGKAIFTIQEAATYWGSPHNAKIALHRLIRKGLLASLERGKYMVIPFEAGTERTWSEEPYLVASALVKPAAIAYWTAIRHWNWTEQIPRIIYIQTTTRKKATSRTVFGVQYQFVTVPKAKFYGQVKEWYKGKPVLVSDREKTLVNCADDVERAGSIEELAKAVKASAREISWQKLTDYIGRFPNGAVPKRLGYLFETLVPRLPGEAKEVLLSWQKKLSAGIVPLQPSKKKTGKVVTRWCLRINADVG